jgi:hypothetical protein
MPISLSIEFMSSIWSDEISSDGRTAFNSSCVTQPRFLAILSIRLTAASLRSSKRAVGGLDNGRFALGLHLIFFCHRGASVIPRPTAPGVQYRPSTGSQGRAVPQRLFRPSLRPSFREAPKESPPSPSLARAVAHLSWGLSGQIADEVRPD